MDIYFYNKKIEMDRINEMLENLENIENEEYEENKERIEALKNEYEEYKKELIENLDEEVDDLIKLYKNYDGLKEQMKKERNALYTREKLTERKMDRLKETIKFCMDTKGIKKKETAVGNITIRKTPMSIDILNIEEIPEKFKKEVIDIKVDKREILKEIKETGEVIDGIKIIDNKTSLSIK